MPASKKPSAAATQQTKILKMLTDAVGELKTANVMFRETLFGRWDEEKLEKVPGIQDRLVALKEHQDEKDKADRAYRAATAKRDRRILAVGLFFALILVSRAFGAPTEAIGQGIGNAASTASAYLAQNFWTYLVH